MAVELHLFVAVNCHVVAIAAQVVAGQIYEHHVFCIFLRVVAQVFRILAVFLHIAGAFGRAGNRVDVCSAIADAAVCLGRGTKDAESAEIEIEKEVTIAKISKDYKVKLSFNDELYNEQWYMHGNSNFAISRNLIEKNMNIIQDTNMNQEMNQNNYA